MVTQACKKVVPDGGWGWIVVAGVALTNTTNQALFSLFGLIFGEQLESMTSGALGVMIVMSINVMVTNFSGLFTGPILKTYSVRTVTIFGVICTSLGMIISSQANNIFVIIVGYGVLTGLGLGLIASSTFLAVNSYFNERKSLAVGISMAGTSLGQMGMPHVVAFLFDEYGFSGTTLILGGLCLHGIVGAMLFHPVEMHMKGVSDEVAILTDETRITIINTEKQTEAENSQTTEEEVKTCSKPWCKNICKTLIEKLDLELLKDPVFLHIVVGLGLVYACTVAFGTFLPLFLMEDIELELHETTTCMSMLSGADIAGRLMVPFLSKVFKISNRTTFLIGAVALALVRSYFVEQTSYTMLLVLALMIGFVRAATVINQNLTISEYSTEEKLPAALGLNMVVKGVVVLVFGQVLGVIKDNIDSYRYCIHLVDVIVLIVAASWTVELVHKKLKRM